MNNIIKNLRILGKSDKFNKCLGKKELNLLYYIFSNSVDVYRELINENVQAFSGEYFDSFKVKLLGYIVQKAFDPKLVPNNFPFKVNVSKMNFNQRRAELRIGNIILSIAKGNGKCKLPSYSNYKREYSMGNSDMSNQLRFDFSDEGKVKGLPYYGIIVYDVDNDELKDLNIVIPNDEFTNILGTIPVKYNSEIDMNVKSIDIEEFRQYIKNEIINNPNVIDGY